MSHPAGNLLQTVIIRDRLSQAHRCCSRFCTAANTSIAASTSIAAHDASCCCSGCGDNHAFSFVTQFTGAALSSPTRRSSRQTRRWQRCTACTPLVDPATPSRQCVVTLIRLILSPWHCAGTAARACPTLFRSQSLSSSSTTTLPLLLTPPPPQNRSSALSFRTNIPSPISDCCCHGPGRHLAAAPWYPEQQAVRRHRQPAPRCTLCAAHCGGLNHAAKYNAESWLCGRYVGGFSAACDVDRLTTVFSRFGTVHLFFSANAT